MAGWSDGGFVACSGEIQISQNTNCEGIYLAFIDAEARKRGDRTGLDTLVVHAKRWLTAVLVVRLSIQAKSVKLTIPPGEYAARLKLKGTDGGPAQAVEHVV